jgi:hypothetical protein
LLKVGGRLLFADPITVTGALTNAKIAVRNSTISICGFRMVMTNALLRNAHYGCS